jgi:predicted nucleic acid-binding protein
MGLKLLLDSVILIDHLNGVAAASTWLTKEHLNSAISVITRAEVLAGYDAHQRQPIQRLLDAFPALPIDQKVADTAAALRREHRWKLPDAFQAALARTHKLTLVTRNTKDFRPDQFSSDQFDWVMTPYQF